jgi:deoxyribose-phosphate aldolase
VRDADVPLHGTGVNICCVVGFPEGTQSTEHKITEGAAAVERGARELDVVLNRDLLQSGQYMALYLELSKIRLAFNGLTLKLILETSQLTYNEKIAAVVMAGHAFFDYVKTSTGFLGHGATSTDVKLMAAVAKYMGSPAGANLPDLSMLVKASGGVRTLNDLQIMVEAGAARIGTSNGVSIMEEAGHTVGIGEVPPMAKQEAIKHGKSKSMDSGGAVDNLLGGAPPGGPYNSPYGPPPGATGAPGTAY